MLLAAQLRPHKICGLIGIAPAPDFTEELIIPHLSSAQQEELSLQGLIDFAAGECEESYPISAQLLSDAKDHLVLTKPLNINLPVRLIHGQLDQDVPYKYSLRLSELLQSSDVTISLIKSGHHNLSSPDALSHIHHIISELMSLCSSSIK
jgi:pimeloyl-ACP methyl ester carboxylesterase